MIELRIVRRMVRRALVAAPLLIGWLWLAGGPGYAVSGGIGLALTLAQMWAAARIIGGTAENNPQFLLGAAMGTFVLTLVMLGAIAVSFDGIDFLSFKVTGLVLVVSHLALVLAEAAETSFTRLPASEDATLPDATGTRS